MTFRIDHSLKLINNQFTSRDSYGMIFCMLLIVWLSVVVYRHPLFPLLALMLEKCEEATRGEADTQTVLSSLENDVQVFIQHEKDGNKMLTTDDVEVDELVRQIRSMGISLFSLTYILHRC